MQLLFRGNWRNCLTAIWEELLLKCTPSHSGATHEFSAKQYKVHNHVPISFISL